MTISHRARNNFDALRLFAAILVLTTHSWALLGILPHDFIARWTNDSFTASWLGLAIFFSLSGFLIDGSAASSPNWKAFAKRRFLRLWPGLTAVVLTTIFVIGPLVSNLGPGRYFTSWGTWFYLSTLTIWGTRWKLPGAFAGNPLVEVNGSLWTLPYETTLYVISWILRGKGNRGNLILFGIFIAGVVARSFFYQQICAIPFRPMLISLQHLLNFGLFYIAGSCIRRVWHRQRLLQVALLVSGVAWMMSISHEHWRIPLDFIVLPLGVILLGSFPIRPFDQAARWGDLSYGVYIWGFPIQQILIYCCGANRLNPGLLTFLAILCAFPIAFASWHLIEKRSLAYKDRQINLGPFKL
jgi:peptidoglycan/LPS O-acetylase OafA/YrhL